VNSLRDSIPCLLGLEPDSFAGKSLESKLDRLMREDGFDDPVQYRAHLDRSPQALQTLVQALVVPESWFFREPAAFQRLVTRIRGPVRILSLPCARGEEPYSIAMSLLMAGFTQFSVDAIDVSEQFIETARKGVYGPYSFRGKKPEELAGYVRPKGDRFQVVDFVRDRVRFAQGNVLHGVPWPGTYDFIFCRNLLIYLTPSARESAMNHLLSALAPDGEIYVANCEAATMPPDRFQARVSTFAFCRALHPTLTLPVARKQPRKPQPAPAMIETREPPPKPALESPVDISEAWALADVGRLEEARSLCLRDLEQRGPQSDTYFLMAVIAAAEDSHQAAREMLRRTLYLEPTHYRALQHIAVYAERDGQAELAALYRRRAEHAGGRP